MILKLDEAKLEAQKQKYALIYRSSGIFLGEVTEEALSGLFETEAYESDGCLEARFFSNDSEIHIFRGDEGVTAVFTSFAGTESIEEKYQVASAFKGNLAGLKNIVVKKIIDYDEDGQAYVKQTCLSGLEV